MMDITLNELLRRKRAAHNHHISSDSTPENQQQQKKVPSKNPGTHFSEIEDFPDKVGEKRKRNEYGDTENRSKSEDVIVNRSESGNRRLADDIGDAGEENGCVKELHEINFCQETLPNAMNKNAQVGAAMGISQTLEADNNSGFCDTRSQVAVQPKTCECTDPKFNDFDKLREEVNFAVGQTWALYDTVDGMPRLYAQIRKVSVPSFRLRITYLEPDPDDEKEKLWFEEDLPVSVGTFRLGNNQSTKDRSIFSHVIHCSERINPGRFSSTWQFSVSPRKGETWALFKNWDIKWSSEPDSHRKYEYEFVEILSDYADEAGVFVAYLHKAKGFASVFFRMGTGYEGIFRILPPCLYRFAYRVPSFRLTGIEGKGLPKDAYELDQSALPETIEEIIVPLNSGSDRKSKCQAIYFASRGKVFQTGQIWSYYTDDDELPLYYGRIQKISLTQVLGQEAVYKLHISRLKATPFPLDVIGYEDKKMPVGCGNFYARKALDIITPRNMSDQMIPQISMDGIEYTILPKIGEVWVIYRYWSSHIEAENLVYNIYDIVEILDDTLDYKVQLLEYESHYDYDDADYKFANRLFKASKEYTYSEGQGTEPIFTITKSERNRFSNKVPASSVTIEMHGELKDFLSVEHSVGTSFLKVNFLTFPVGFPASSLPGITGL